MFRRKIAAVCLVLVFLVNTVTVFANAPFAFEQNKANQGFPVKAKTAIAEYFFENDNDEYNLSLVSNAELIFDTAFEECDFEITLPKVYFTSNDNKAEVKPKKAVINPQSESSMGALLYYMSGLKLPAWLSAGLELYWLDQSGRDFDGIALDKEIDVTAWTRAAEAEGLPGFGDAWFIPGLIDSELAEAVPSIAYVFAKYIDENDKIKKLADTYTYEFVNMQTYKMDNTVKDADKLAEELWMEMTGCEDAAGILGYKYLYNSSRFSDEDVLFIYSGVHGTYSFCRADSDWKLDTVEKYNRVNENSISYAKDWFGYDYDKPIRVILITRPHEELLGFATTRDSLPIILLYDCFEQFNLVGIHEAVHALRIATGEFWSYQSLLEGYFEEGIAEAIRYLYSRDNEEYASLYIKPWEAFLKETYTSDYSEYDSYTIEEMETILDIYERLTNASLIDSQPDFFAYVDVMVINFITDSWNGYLAGKEEYEWVGNNRYWFIKEQPKYTCISSFMRYLLNVGSEENFKRLCADPYAAEEIYGKDLEGLVGEWLNYLGFDFFVPSIGRE